MTEDEKLLWILMYLLKKWKDEDYADIDADTAVKEYRASQSMFRHETEDSK